MSKWIDFTTAERLVMVQQVAGQKHISEAAVEKDWWVTMTLKAIFATSLSRYLLFKGGLRSARDGISSTGSVKTSIYPLTGSTMPTPWQINARTSSVVPTTSRLRN